MNKQRNCLCHRKASLIQVWFLLVFTVSLIGPVTYAFIWYNNRILPPTSTHTLEELSFNAFRSFVVQGNRLRISGTLRCIAFTWFFFCFLINALYAGTLTAFLAIPAFEKPLDSLQDLLEAAGTKGLIFTVMNGSSNEALFQEARSGLYKRVRDVAFRPADSLVSGSDEGVDRPAMIFSQVRQFEITIMTLHKKHDSALHVIFVMTAIVVTPTKRAIIREITAFDTQQSPRFRLGNVRKASYIDSKTYSSPSGVHQDNTAYIHARLAIITRIHKRGRNRYYLARRSFYPQAYGIAFRSGSPFRFSINKQLRRLSESGLVDKWAKDELGKLRGETDDEGADVRGPEVEPGERPGGRPGGREGEPGAITLSHLQAAFYLLFFGWFFAFGALVGEIEWDRRSKSKDNEVKAVNIRRYHTGLFFLQPPITKDYKGAACRQETFWSISRSDKKKNPNNKK
ncbi:uncharacterized protein LOC143040943 [Oratosquilla oratoria]|uniref:uncharacterized protein LOC143040943 n=1 Tax=Oratosquilla oratoria TaxID=337810 RepID=UPI003F757E97